MVQQSLGNLVIGVFFVSGCSGDSFGSAISFAEQVINEINNSGQTLPSSQGKFYLIFTSNAPIIEIHWETVNGVWYELDWERDPIETIKVLRSMVNVNNANRKSWTITLPRGD